MPFASDSKYVTLLQFNERNSKPVAGVFRWCLLVVGCIMHGALATCKGTFVVKQISLLKLQTCISTILDPRQCLAMPASSIIAVSDVRVTSCSVDFDQQKGITGITANDAVLTCA